MANHESAQPIAQAQHEEAVLVGRMIRIKKTNGVLVIKNRLGFPERNPVLSPIRSRRLWPILNRSNRSRSVSTQIIPRALAWGFNRVDWIDFSSRPRRSRSRSYVQCKYSDSDCQVDNSSFPGYGRSGQAEILNRDRRRGINTGINPAILERATEIPTNMK